jgi:hypothetical protein
MSLRDDEQLIQDALDHKLDARRFAALEARLLREPELRELYLSYSRMDGLLGEKFGDSESKITPIRRKPTRWMAWGALAASLAGLAALLPFALKDQPECLVEFGPESHGRVIHRQGDSGERVLRVGSRLELEHGSASVRLRDGGRAYFEGPGALEMVEPTRFRLQEGRAWFESGEGNPVACVTEAFEIHAGHGEFGVIATNQAELHVLSGELSVLTPDGKTAGLSAGHSARWDGETLLTADTATAFTTGFPKAVTIFADNFDEPDLTPLSGKMPDTGAGPWKIEYGGPLIENGILDTSGNVRHTAFAPLEIPVLDDVSHVLLLTLETEDPATSRFHSPGWAGVSLYTGDQERIFVGDPCGLAEGWALHPAGYSARNACPLLHGKSTVTLRYDYRTGLAQLFEGTDTSGPALASEWIEPGLQFDRIRIANGSQADAAVDAGKPASAAGDGPGVEVRGDIALRNLRLSVLSADARSVAAQP